MWCTFTYLCNSEVIYSAGGLWFVLQIVIKKGVGKCVTVNGIAVQYQIFADNILFNC